MAGQNWRKNKKGFMVNPEGKTARQVKQEKYAAKKAEAKAKASGASTDNLTWEQQKSLNALTGGKSPIFSKLSDKSKRELLKISDELEALNREADRDRATGKGAWKRPSEAFLKREGKRSNRYRLLRNRVEALDDEKGTAKTASKGSEEKIATQKTKKPSDMSAREMQKEYQQIDDKQAKLTDKLIEAGFSRVTMSEISRRRNENPLFKEYAELSDRAKELTLEAEIRGGPGFRVRDLTSKHSNPYAKKDSKSAKPASEEIDPSRYLESNTSKMINTAYRVNKFDIDMVSSRKKAGDFDVEGEARKIASAGGVTTNLPLVAMRQDKKIEVVAGDREFFANKRAQELNPNEEMVSGVFLKSSQIKGALAQKSVFKDHEGDFTVQSGQFSRVDTADIESSIKQPSKKVLDAQVKALLDTGDVGNVIPVILQRVGKKSAVNQKYKVVSGHDSFLAMRELKRRNPNYEMTNAFILD